MEDPIENDAPRVPHKPKGGKPTSSRIPRVNTGERSPGYRANLGRVRGQGVPRVKADNLRNLNSIFSGPPGTSVAKPPASNNLKPPPKQIHSVVKKSRDESKNAGDGFGLLTRNLGQRGEAAQLAIHTNMDLDKQGVNFGMDSEESDAAESDEADPEAMREQPEPLQDNGINENEHDLPHPSLQDTASDTEEQTSLDEDVRVGNWKQAFVELGLRVQVVNQLAVAVRRCKTTLAPLGDMKGFAAIVRGMICEPSNDASMFRQSVSKVMNPEPTKEELAAATHVPPCVVWIAPEYNLAYITRILAAVLKMDIPLDQEYAPEHQYMPLGVRLLQVNPLVDKRLGRKGRKYAQSLLPLTNNTDWQRCLKLSSADDVQWLERVVDLAAVQLQSSVVQCQHTGAHTMWEISTMQPSVRPAFHEQIVQHLLAVDLEPNRMLMGQVRAWGNQPSLAPRIADHHIKVLLQVGAVEFSAAALWWMASAKFDLADDPDARARRELKVVSTVLHWMQEVHLGGDVMGSKRGRAARKVMLEQMCVGLLATILLNNAASSAVVETLGQDLVHEPATLDTDDAYTSAQMHFTGWQLVGRVTAHLAKFSSDSLKEQPTAFELHIFNKYQTIMTDLVLMPPLAVVPNSGEGDSVRSDAEESQVGVRSVFKAAGMVEPGGGAQSVILSEERRALRDQIEQTMAAAATLERLKDIENSAASTFCTSLRSWGTAAVRYLDAAGGCNWILKLLTSDSEPWQHCGASLIELYASTERGRERLALRVEELGAVLEALSELLAKPHSKRHVSAQGVSYTLHHTCAAALSRCGDAVIEKGATISPSLVQPVVKLAMLEGISAPAMQGVAACLVRLATMPHSAFVIVLQERNALPKALACMMKQEDPHVQTCAVVVMGLLARHSASGWGGLAVSSEVDTSLVQMRSEFVELLAECVSKTNKVHRRESANAKAGLSDTVPGDKAKARDTSAEALAFREERLVRKKERKKNRKPKSAKLARQAAKIREEGSAQAEETDAGMSDGDSSESAWSLGSFTAPDSVQSESSSSTAGTASVTSFMSSESSSEDEEHDAQRAPRRSLVASETMSRPDSPLSMYTDAGDPSSTSGTFARSPGMDTMQEAAGAAMFVLSLGPGSALAMGTPLVPTPREVSSIGGLVRTAAAGSRALTLACATAWCIACEGGDTANSKTLARMGGSDLARWLAKAAQRCWSRLPSEQLGNTMPAPTTDSAAAVATLLSTHTTPGARLQSMSRASSAGSGRGPSSRRSSIRSGRHFQGGLDPKTAELEAAASFALGALWVMAYRLDGVEALFGSELQRRTHILHGDKKRVSQSGEWAVEILGYMMMKSSRAGVVLPMIASIFHTCALRCAFHRRTLANLGVGMVAEAVLYDLSASTQLRALCSELALALLDIIPRAPPPHQKIHHTRTDDKCVAAAQADAKKNSAFSRVSATTSSLSRCVPRSKPVHPAGKAGNASPPPTETRAKLKPTFSARDIFMWPRPWEPPPDVDTLELQIRVHLDEECALDRAQWATGLAVQLMSSSELELKQVGARAAAILGSRPGICSRLAGWGVVEPLHSILLMEDVDHYDVALAINLSALALYNMSQNVLNQPVLGQRTLPELLRICLRGSTFSDPLIYKLHTSAHRCAMGTLHNIMHHPTNRTEFYKAELLMRRKPKAPSEDSPPSIISSSSETPFGWQALDEFDEAPLLPVENLSRSSSFAQPRNSRSSGAPANQLVPRLQLDQIGTRSLASTRPSSGVQLPTDRDLPSFSQLRRSMSSRVSGRKSLTADAADESARARLAPRPHTHRGVRRAEAGSREASTPRPSLINSLRKPIRSLWSHTLHQDHRVQTLARSTSAGTLDPVTSNVRSKQVSGVGQMLRPSSSSCRMRRYSDANKQWATMMEKWAAGSPIERRKQRLKSVTIMGTQAAKDVSLDTHWTLSSASIPAPPIGQNLGLEEWTRGWSDSTFTFDDQRQAQEQNSELAGKMTSSDVSYASVVKENYSGTTPLQKARTYQVAYTHRKDPVVSRESTPRVTVALTPRPPRTTATINSVKVKTKHSRAADLLPKTERKSPEEATEVFSHVEGCTVCRGLYSHFTLEDGKQVHCVHKTSKAPTPAVSVVWQPLPAPLELGHIFQDNWPSTTFLDTLVRPPHEWVQLWDAAMYPALKGGPPVKIPKVVMNSPPLQLIVEYRAQPDVGSDRKKDSLENADNETAKSASSQTHVLNGALKEHDDYAWLWRSNFQTRALQDSESRDFFDSPAVVLASMNKDWQYLMRQSSFSRMLGVQLTSVQTVFRYHFPLIRHLYEYYSVIGGAGGGINAEFQMDEDEWLLCLMECQIIEDNPESTCTASRMAEIFTSVNEGESFGSNSFNVDRVFLRVEFLRALVEVAAAKFVHTQRTESLAEALHQLCANHLAKNPRTESGHSANVFRRARLYTHAVDEFLDHNSAFLKAVYDIFRGAHRRMTLSDWLAFLRETGLLMPEVTGLGRREACLCFLWARTQFSDELRSMDKARSLTFIDFLEALARAADTICPPTDEELSEWGARGTDALYYYYYRIEKSVTNAGGGVLNRKIPRRPSAAPAAAKTRPLEEKLSKIVGVVRRSIMTELDIRDEDLLIRMLSEGSRHVRQKLRRQ